MNRRPPDPTRDPVASNVEKIRDAALVSFAARGVGATSLREVACAAGVSIGLVQHHFGTKAGLVEAVDRHVAEVLRTSLATGPGPTTTEAFGQQVTTLLAEHTTAMDYLARTLVEATPTGNATFDALVAMGDARWEQRAEHGLLRPDLDRTWATLNPLLLVLGAIILRSHLDRHLSGHFTSAAQLSRWEDAVNDLLRRGQLRPED
ncbi:TetR/AcrR family transcriptional regulator [Mycolicibacterium sp. J2]|uniref:TetR/AcrR family transcriptional regulator n=1 Tax=Mycolicibacterium sp. J2 TaxID=2993511 RepID=UPI00224AB916|nr:TetR/AcrR family transcriptional regulator [Mycolicibacterium sp. J2]MCX2712115.1 helix-turn-helix domain containing protein [Mycolicibacterium sp. J2]